MPKVTLTIPPETDQVRTARLVAGTAARRGGVGEDDLDDLRLAVGECVGRAVLRHQRAGIAADVVVHLRDDPEAFEVEVVDAAPANMPDEDDGLSVALSQSLAPRYAVSPDAQGNQRVRMVWPLPETA